MSFFGSIRILTMGVQVEKVIVTQGSWTYAERK